MITIRANNTWLDISPKASISINVVSPLFDRDRIERAYSFPFTLPTTPTNLKALKHINRIDAEARVKYSAEVHIHGHFFEAGYLSVTGSTDKEIRAVFQSASINLAETLRSIRLRELDILHEVSSEYCPSVIIGSVYPVPAGSIERMALRINEHVFDTHITELDEMIDQINAVFGPIASEPALGQPFNENLILIQCPGIEDFRIYFTVEVDDPSIYVFFLLTDSDYDSEATRIQADYNTLVGAGGDTMVAFPVMRVPNLYDGKNNNYSGYVNYTDTSNQHPNDAALTIGADGWPHTLIPLPYASKLLPYLSDAAGLQEIGGPFWLDKEILQLLLWNNRTLDFVVSAEDYIVERDPSSPKHTYTPIINIAKHLPDISAFELLQYFSNTFCLVARLKLGRLEFTPCRDVLSSPPEDWTHYAEPQYNQQINGLQGYTLDYNRQGDETELPGQLERIDGGQDAQEFRPDFYTLFEVAETDREDVTRSWRIPYITEHGQVMYYDLEDSPTLRLLFYRSLQQDSEGNNYAMASSGNQDHQGNQNGTYTLSWPGAAGLYEQWWKDYINLVVNGREVTRTFRLPAYKLLDLKRNPLRRIAVYSAHGAMVGYFKSVRVKAMSNGISLSEVTIVTA